MDKKLLEKCKNIRADMFRMENENFFEGNTQLDVILESIYESIRSGIREIEDLNVKDGVDLLEGALYDIDSIKISENNFEYKMFVEIKEFLAAVEPVLKAHAEYERILNKRCCG